MKRILMLGVLVLLTCMGFASAALNDAYIYWAMDTNGTVAIDSAAHLNGTISGLTNTTPILGAGSRLKNANTDRIVSAAKFYLGTNWSYSMIIKPTTVSGTTFISYRDDAGAGYGFTCDIPTNKTQHCYIRNGGAWVEIFSNRTISTGSANLVGLTFAGTSYTFYINGTAAGTGTASINMNAPLYFVACNGYSNPIDGGNIGVCDEAAVWNRTLTSAEMSQLYNNGSFYNPYTSTPAADPVVTFVSPTPDTNTYYNINDHPYIQINASVANAGIGTMKISLYNASSGGLKTDWTDNNSLFVYKNFTGANLTQVPVTLDYNATYNSTNVSETRRVIFYNASVSVPRPTHYENVTRFLNINISSTFTDAGVNVSSYRIGLQHSLGSFEVINANTTNSTYIYDLFTSNISTTVSWFYVTVNMTDTKGVVTSGRSEIFYVVSNAQLNVSLYDSVTGLPVNNFSVNVTNLDTGTFQRLNSTGSLLTIDIKKNDNYNLVYDAPGYALKERNYTANTSAYQAVNDSLPGSNSVMITVYDEASLNIISGVQTNITFTSNETSFDVNTSTGSLFVRNITEGFYEVKFKAPLYNERSYYITVTNRSTQSLSAFLSTSAVTLLLTYVDKETGEPLEGCGIVIAKVINGSWETVVSGFTDITGRFQSSTSTNTNYRFSSTCANYEDKTFNLNPVIFTSYTIRLTRLVNSGDKLDFTNINVYVTNATFTNNGTNYWAWQISSPAGELERFSYRLYTQCKNISAYQGTNAYGGTDSQTFNLSCATLADYVTLDYSYTLSNGSDRNFSLTYSIMGNATSGTFVANKNNKYGLGLFERAFILVLIVIIFAGIVTKFSNIVAGLASGLLVSSYLSYIGFVEWWLVAPTLLVGFVILTSWSQTR